MILVKACCVCMNISVIPLFMCTTSGWTYHVRRGKPRHARAGWRKVHEGWSSSELWHLTSSCRGQIQLEVTTRRNKLWTYFCEAAIHIYTSEQKQDHVGNMTRLPTWKGRAKVVMTTLEAWSISKPAYHAL